MHQAHVVIDDPSAGVLLNDGMAIQLVPLSVCCPAVQLLLTNSTYTNRHRTSTCSCAPQHTLHSCMTRQQMLQHGPCKAHA